MTLSLQRTATSPLPLLTNPQWYQVDPATLSLRFDPQTPFDVWMSCTEHLLEAEKAIQWLVGDALTYGEDAYGEPFAQVLDPQRYSHDHVVRMARTARAIPPARRRPDLGYSIHAEVALLPEPHQETILDYAQEHDSTVLQVRAQVRAAQAALKQAERAARGTPALGDGGPVLALGDARELPLPDGCIDLIVVSPPYGIGVTYGVGDIDAEHWLDWLEDALREWLRVTAAHGRLALNIPLDTAKGGKRSTYADAVVSAKDMGWTYESTITWHEGTTTKGNRALGSVNSSAHPYHVSQVEMIGLFSKGDWGPSSGRPDDITSEQWQEAGRSPWTFPGESHPWEGYPAAFPVELPRRLIRYLSRVGDSVLDPCVGSGTTLVACQETGRRGYGYDLDPGAIACATRRLACLKPG